MVGYAGGFHIRTYHHQRGHPIDAGGFFISFSF
jgi:hypothetical protein